MKLPAMARIPMVLILAVAAGCSFAPSAQPTASPQRIITLIPTATPLPTPIPMPTATETPDPTAVPTEVATSLPTEVPTASPSPSIMPTPTAILPWPDHRGRPPAGILTVGNDSIEGRGGSYCWGDTCADIGGWPPKADLPELDMASRNATIRFSASKPVGFTEWYASYAPGPNGQAKLLDQGGSPSDPDANSTQPPEFETVDFPSPPSGDWIVYVSVYFRGGDLSYAWHVIVS